MVLLGLNLDDEIFFGRNSFSSDADYHKEFITESGAWKLLWEELEIVALLELNRKHVNFFLGGIHLELMLVTIVEPAESKTRNGGFFCLRRNSSSNNTNYNRESSVVLEAVVQLKLKQ
uniref:Uncharacterized protein n=1 Tax=Strongyloides stercoralis TaxID=6248 RepID=A0AAF5CY11_STRER